MNHLSNADRLYINPNNNFTVYLSGPVSSRLGHNPDIFYQYENEYVQKDCKVINPLRLAQELETIMPKQPRYSELMMYKLINMVQSADAVVVLPGWDISPESRLEVSVALSLGMPVYCGTDPNALNLGVDINFYDKDVITEYGQTESFTEPVKKLIDQMNNIDKKMPQ